MFHEASGIEWGKHSPDERKSARWNYYEFPDLRGGQAVDFLTDNFRVWRGLPNRPKML